MKQTDATSWFYGDKVHRERNYVTRTKSPDFPHPDRRTSITDFTASFAQSTVRQMDLVTKAPKEAVLA